MTPAPLTLTYGDQSWALDVRPLTIGRLPECDVVVAADQVSRNHAYLVPTPEGPLLVDRSRHGTTVNGEARHGLSVLREGDEIRVGPAVLLVRRGDRRTSAELGAMTERAWPAKVRHWIRRYGPSEVFGTVAAVGVAGIVKQSTGSTVAAAYLGTIAEIVVFYGIMFLRESIREAHQAGRRGRSYGNADLLELVRNLGLEFGIAELLDTGLVRPLCIGLGIQFLGGTLGALAGKLTADVAFYGPVLAMYEWRLARTHPSVLRDRLRRTTSAGIPIPPE
jgi:hypothetical protein